MKFTKLTSWNVINVGKRTLEEISADLSDRELIHCRMNNYNQVILGPVETNLYDELNQTYGTENMSHEFLGENGRDCLRKLNRGFLMTFLNLHGQTSDFELSTIACSALYMNAGSVEAFHGNYEELFELARDRNVSHIEAPKRMFPSGK